MLSDTQSACSVPATLAAQRAAIARATRQRDESAEVAARQDYAASKLADYITRTVEACPPLTAAQRDKLALLLRGGPGEAA